MDKKEALSLIKQVVAIYKGTLQEHQLLQEAIKVLESNDVSPAKEKKK